MVFHRFRCFPVLLTCSLAWVSTSVWLFSCNLDIQSPPHTVVSLLLRSLSRGITTESDTCASIMACNRHYCLRVSLGLCACDRFGPESHYYLTAICHCYFRASLCFCHRNCLRLLPCSLLVASISSYCCTWLLFPAYLSHCGFLGVIFCYLHGFYPPLVLTGITRIISLHSGTSSKKHSSFTVWGLGRVERKLKTTKTIW